MKAHHTSNPWTYLDFKRSKVKVTRQINARVADATWLMWNHSPHGTTVGEYRVRDTACLRSQSCLNSTQNSLCFKLTPHIHQIILSCYKHSREFPTIQCCWSHSKYFLYSFRRIYQTGTVCLLCVVFSSIAAMSFRRKRRLAAHIWVNEVQRLLSCVALSRLDPDVPVHAMIVVKPAYFRSSTWSNPCHKSCHCAAFNIV